MWNYGKKCNLHGPANWKCVLLCRVYFFQLLGFVSKAIKQSIPALTSHSVNKSIIWKDNFRKSRVLPDKLHRLILKVTKFQLPPLKRLSTVVQNIFFLGGGGQGTSWPPMSNRVNSMKNKVERE